MSRIWPIGIVLFFIFIAVTNISFVVLAYRTAPGAIEENSYEKGLVYETEIARLRAAEGLSWAPEIVFSEQDEFGFRTVFVSIGELLEGDIGIKIDFICPSEAPLDIRGVVMEPDGRRYRSRVHLPKDGLWFIRLLVEAGEKDFGWRERVFLG